MHGKKLIPIAPKIAPKTAPKGFLISREGVFSKLIKKSSPKRPPARRAKRPRAGARAQAGGEAPATGINAPAPSVPAPTPTPFVAENPPLYLSSTSSGADTVSGMLAPDSSLASEPLDMQASYHMFGTVDALHQGPYEPPQMSASTSHQMPTGGFGFGPMFLQTAEAQYDSAFIQPYPAYTPFGLGEDDARIHPYLAEPFPLYGSGPSTIQPQAGAWGTEPSGDMSGAPVSLAQQVPTSVITPVHSHDN